MATLDRWIDHDVESMSAHEFAAYIFAQPWGSRAEAVLQELRAASSIEEPPATETVIEELADAGATGYGREWDTGNTMSTLAGVLEDAANDDVAAILALRRVYDLPPLG